MNKRKSNAKPRGKQFTSEYQPSREAKSRGQLKRRQEENLICTLRTEIQNTTLLHDTVIGIHAEVQSGKFDNAVKLLNIAKEPEKQEIGLNGDVNVQKVYITKEEIEETDKHINDIIGE